MQFYFYRDAVEVHWSVSVFAETNINQSLGQSMGPESAVWYPGLNKPEPFISTAVLMHLFIMIPPMSHETKGLPSEM